MKAYEVNFDGLVGPSHNYAGLSAGNLASTNNAGDLSSPKKAALQGLAKAKSLADLGLKQGILAPQARPDFRVLRQLGFTGSDKDILEKSFKKAPELLAACFSASAMWTANAATISPSADCGDSKVHITPANLNSKFHRSIEVDQTAKILKASFASEKYFVHHLPLPAVSQFGDEGAANHTRFCSSYEKQGLELFVFGKYGFLGGKKEPLKFPARQSFEASQAVANLHGLREQKTVFAQQNPEVIDAGVFHNDVISVGNKNVYFYHEYALLHKEIVLAEIRQKFGGGEFHFIEVPNQMVSVKDSVGSYLFNSQLLSLSENKMAIVVPEECRTNQKVWTYLQEELLPSNNPITEVLVYDVKESMKNGGGPACLRLRVSLTEEELGGVNQNTLLDNTLYEKLVSWVEKHYRDSIAPMDLADYSLAMEIQTSLDELTGILNLGSIYPFQV